MLQALLEGMAKLLLARLKKLANQLSVNVLEIAFVVEVVGGSWY